VVNVRAGMNGFKEPDLASAGVGDVGLSGFVSAGAVVGPGHVVASPPRASLGSSVVPIVTTPRGAAVADVDGTSICSSRSSMKGGGFVVDEVGSVGCVRDELSREQKALINANRALAAILRRRTEVNVQFEQKRKVKMKADYELQLVRDRVVSVDKSLLQARVTVAEAKLACERKHGRFSPDAKARALEREILLSCEDEDLGDGKPSHSLSVATPDMVSSGVLNNTAAAGKVSASGKRNLLETFDSAGSAKKALSETYSFSTQDWEEEFWNLKEPVRKEGEAGGL